MNDALAKADPYQPQSLDSAEKLAARLAQSPLMPAILRGKPGDVLVVMMTGHELGLSPMQALRGLYVVGGKVAMYADLAVALVKRHPDCAYFRLIETSEKQAVYETQRRGDPQPTKLAFTMQQAQLAGLASNQNYAKHPAAMLRARAAMALARVVYPDMLQGIYSPDELEVEAQMPSPQQFVAPVAPAKKEQPEDAQLVEPVEPPPPAQMDQTAPDNAGAEEQALHAIAAAESTKDLAKMISTLPKTLAVRSAYNARNKELRTGAVQ